MSRFVFILILFISLQTYGQDEYFNELEFSATLLENENWELELAPNWKHIYDEVGWRRLGISTTVIRKLGAWKLSGGVNINYRFDKEIENFLELRPWFGIGLRTIIADGLIFSQRFKSEYRTFIFEDDTPNTSYGRLRYQVSIGYTLSENEASNTAWKVNGIIEWYFIRDPIVAERFPNSRELSIRFTREFSNEHAFSFGYKLEDFFETSGNIRGKGHIVVLEYRL